MKKCLVFLFLLANFVRIFAQQQLNFQINWENEPLILSKNYFSNFNKDSLKIEKLQFYVSDICLLKKGKIVYKLLPKYKLIDLENPNSQQIKFKTKKKFDAVQFNLGIDSLTNASGAKSGDLDPRLGMYWAWQSGYINLKMEGHSPICTSRNQFFQFHLGGFLNNFYAIQKIQFTVNQQNMNVKLQIDKFFEQVNLSQQHEIMSPNQKAVVLSQIIANSFKID